MKSLTILTILGAISQAVDSQVTESTNPNTVLQPLSLDRETLISERELYSFKSTAPKNFISIKNIKSFMNAHEFTNQISQNVNPQLGNFIYRIFFSQNFIFRRFMFMGKVRWRRFVEMLPQIKPSALVFYIRTIIHFFGNSLYIQNRSQLHFFISKFVDKLQYLKLISEKSNSYLALILTELVRKQVKNRCSLDFQVVLRKMREKQIKNQNSIASSKMFFDKSKTCLSTYKVNIPKILSRFTDYSIYIAQYKVAAEGFLQKQAKQAIGYREFSAEMQKFRMKWQFLKFAPVQNYSYAIRNQDLVKYFAEGKVNGRFSKIKELKVPMKPKLFFQIFQHELKGVQFEDFNAVHRIFTKFIDFVNAYDKIKVDKLQMFLAFIKNKETYVGREFRKILSRSKDNYFVKSEDMSLKMFSNALKKYSKKQQENINRFFSKIRLTLMKKQEGGHQVKLFYETLNTRNEQVKEEFSKAMSRFSDKGFKKEGSSIKFFTTVLKIFKESGFKNREEVFTKIIHQLMLSPLGRHKLQLFFEISPKSGIRKEDDTLLGLLSRLQDFKIKTFKNQNFTIKMNTDTVKDLVQGGETFVQKVISRYLDKEFDLDQSAHLKLFSKTLKQMQSEISKKVKRSWSKIFINSQSQGKASHILKMFQNVFQIYKGQIESAIKGQLSRMKDEYMDVVQDITFKYFMNKFLKMRIEKRDEETQKVFTKISYSLKKTSKTYSKLKTMHEIYKTQLGLLNQDLKINLGRYEDFGIDIKDTKAMIHLFAEKTKGSYYFNYKEFKDQYDKYVDLLSFQIPEKKGVQFLKQFASKKYFYNNQYNFEDQFSAILFPHISTKRIRVFKQAYDDKIQENQIEQVADELSKFMIRHLDIHSRSSILFNKTLSAAMKEFEHIESFEELSKFRMFSRVNGSSVSFKSSYENKSPILQHFVHNLFTSKVNLHDLISIRGLKFNAGYSGNSPQLQDFEQDLSTSKIKFFDQSSGSSMKYNSHHQSRYSLSSHSLHDSLTSKMNLHDRISSNREQFSSNYMSKYPVRRNSMHETLTSKENLHQLTKSNFLNFSLKSVNMQNKDEVRLVQDTLFAAIHFRKFGTDLSFLGYQKKLGSKEVKGRKFSVKSDFREQRVFMKKKEVHQFLQFVHGLNKFIKERDIIQDSSLSHLQKIMLKKSSLLNQLNFRLGAKAKPINKKFFSVSPGKRISKFTFKRFSVNQNRLSYKKLKNSSIDVVEKIIQNPLRAVSKIQLKGKNGYMIQYQRDFKHFLKNLSVMQNTQMKKFLLRKYFDEFDKEMKFNQILTRPFMGEKLRMKELNSVFRVHKVENSRNSLQFLISKITKMNKQFEIKTKNVRDQKQKLKVISQLMGSFFKMHPDFKHDFQLIKSQKMMSKIKFNYNPNNEANRVSGKDDSFNLFIQVALRGYEQDFKQMDMGVLRINPIELKDQAIVICCACGCFQEKFGCCNQQDQNNMFFIKDAEKMINVNPSVIVNLFTIDGGILKRELSYQLPNPDQQSLEKLVQTEKENLKKNSKELKELVVETHQQNDSLSDNVKDLIQDYNNEHKVDASFMNGENLFQMGLSKTKSEVEDGQEDFSGAADDFKKFIDGEINRQAKKEKQHSANLFYSSGNTVTEYGSQGHTQGLGDNQSEEDFDSRSQNNQNMTSLSKEDQNGSEKVHELAYKEERLSFSDKNSISQEKQGHSSGNLSEDHLNSNQGQNQGKSENSHITQGHLQNSNQQLKAGEVRADHSLIQNDESNKISGNSSGQEETEDKTSYQVKTDRLDQKRKNSIEQAGDLHNEDDTLGHSINGNGKQTEQLWKVVDETKVPIEQRQKALSSLGNLEYFSGKSNKISNQKGSLSNRKKNQSHQNRNSDEDEDETAQKEHLKQIYYGRNVPELTMDSVYDDLSEQLNNDEFKEFQNVDESAQNKKNSSNSKNRHQPLKSELYNPLSEDSDFLNDLETSTSKWTDSSGDEDQPENMYENLTDVLDDPQLKNIMENSDSQKYDDEMSLVPIKTPKENTYQDLEVSQLQKDPSMKMFFHGSKNQRKNKKGKKHRRLNSFKDDFFTNGLEFFKKNKRTKDSSRSIFSFI